MGLEVAAFACGPLHNVKAAQTFQPDFPVVEESFFDGFEHGFEDLLRFVFIQVMLLLQRINYFFDHNMKSWK